VAIVKVARFLRRLDGDGQPKPTKTMRKAMERGHNGQDLSSQTLAAMERRGWINTRGDGRWHWTPLGRAMVRKFKHNQE
jgi:hypothetical protein